jgi:anti-sigma factor RsiW
MSEHLNELLSSYVDDDVSALERMRVESHVAQCEQCRADLEGLRRVVRRAATLDDRPPQRDLWAGIAERIGEADTSNVVPFAAEPRAAGVRRRRFAFTVPQLAAAAAVLVALSSGGAALFFHNNAGAPATDGSANRAPGIPVNASAEVQITASYDAPIRELQLSLAQRRGQLDTSTVRVIEQSLTVIDAAIRQARAALAKDPNDPYLNGHLQRAFDRKLDLLRQAATLPVVS